MIHPSHLVELAFSLPPATDVGGILSQAAGSWNCPGLQRLWLLDERMKPVTHWAADARLHDPPLPPAILTPSPRSTIRHQDEFGQWCACTTMPGVPGLLVALIESDSSGCDEQCLERMTLLAPWVAQAWSQAEQLQTNQRRIEQMRREQQSLHERYISANNDALEERDRNLQQEIQHREQLEEQVAARSAELREALVQARLASRAKSDFLTNMSHEIRTPLNAMLGYCDLLMKQEPGDPHHGDWLSIIARNGEHLLRLVDDVLDLTRIEGGEIRIQKVACQPSAVIAHTCDILRPRCQSKNVALETDLPIGDLWMTTDPTRLHQILINLVGNAVKFTDSGKIGVRARLEMLGPSDTTPAMETLVIEVHDTGIGMCPHVVERLFQPFEQADSSTTRSHGGAGVGLALSQRIARMLGGVIHCQSKPQVGTTMTLRLPVERRTSQPTGQTVAARAVTPPKPSVAATVGKPRSDARILVAEDGADNRMLIHLYLKHAGLSAVLVENGQLAVNAVAQARTAGKPFDLILMDMQMPVMDGYAATSHLRQSGFTRPIIAVTAHAMAGDRERCLEAGCSDYLTKPIDRARLIDLLAKNLERNDTTP